MNNSTKLLTIFFVFLLRYVLSIALVCVLLSIFAPRAKSAEIVLSDKNMVTLLESVNRKSVAATSLEILQKAQTNDNLILVINSPGGDVLAGRVLMDIIQSSKAKIDCVVVNLAASMAFVILQSCNRRYALKSSILMQHTGSYSVSDEVRRANSKVKFYDRIDKELDAFQAQRIGISVAQFREKIRDDWWLTGAEAKRLNVVDDLVTVSCTPELIEKIIKKEKTGIFGEKATEIYSACPLIVASLSTSAAEEE